MSSEVRVRVSRRRARTGGVLAGVLMATTALCALAAPTLALAQSAGASATRAFNIPAQPLSGALTDFGRQSGLQVSVDAAAIRGVASPGVSGSLAPTPALSRLLAGTGFTYRLTGDVVTLERAPQVSDGVIQLGAVRVEGASGAAAGTGAPAAEGLTEDGVYGRAGGVSHISAERIERYRGSGPADIFRGTPGVLSGEARNGAGAIDLNIRGLQGFGRVATTIDGAENAVTVYQGYQGVSNRTFVDPDFIAGVDVTKGSDAASFGNAGSVAIRTLSAGDIVGEGETWGIRLRGGLRSNTSDPVAGALGGYAYRSGVGTATPSATGMDRPGALEPTGGWASVVGAYRGEAIELVAGYTRREQGDYHAGEHGPVAQPRNIGDTRTSWGGVQRNTMINAGLANYRAGEEVLNTQLETESWLGKVTARIGDVQTVQLGYTGYRSEAGDRLASRQTGREGQPQQQAQTAGTRLDTYTARYRLTPAESDLIDLTANAYWSHLELRNPIRGGRLLKPKDIGLPADFRVGSDSDLWGVDVSNRSRFFFEQGDLDLTYGLSYRGEDTRGSRHAGVLEGWNTPRDGFRHEAAVFGKAAYAPRDWLTVNAGLRYSHFWSEDRVDPYEPSQADLDRVRLGFRKDDGGLSPSLGLVFRPADGVEVYASYASTLRAPSLTEAVSAFNSFTANPNIRPERSNNFELGANLVRDGLFSSGDRGQLKLGYFHWDVDDYIARNVRSGRPGDPGFLSLNIENIDRATFEGVELSGRYQRAGLTANLAANYYLDIQYCRTANTCGDKSLYGDYATNHVPPEYSVELSLSQTLLQDRLTLGGRVQHTGPRAIGHGDVTAQGASQFVALVDWKPFTLTDLFADYRLTADLTASLRVENLFDRFYIDPLGLVTQPGPGRTVTFSLTQSFGGGQTLGWLEPFGDGEVGRDWTGFYLGAHGGADVMSMRGATRTLNGTANPAAALESVNESAGGRLFGLQTGYNLQLANGLVLGFEADWSQTDLRSAEKALSTHPALAAKGFAEATTAYDVSWTGGLRARLGYALSDRWLVYGTGGLALARETQWRDQYIEDQADRWNPRGGETGVFFTERVARTRKGFTAGFGVEHALSDRWSIRADYSYSRFGKDKFDFQNARAGTARGYTWNEAIQIGTEIVPPMFPPGDPFCSVAPEFCQPSTRPVYRYEPRKVQGASDVVEGRRAANDLDLHAIRIGLNFRF